MISTAAIASFQRSRRPVDHLPVALRNEIKVRSTRSGNAFSAPAVNSGERRFGKARNSGGAPHGVDDEFIYGLHSPRYAIFANSPQACFCDNRNCDCRRGVVDARMDPRDIKDELRRRGMSQRDLAQAIDMDENHLSKALAGARQFKVHEMDAIRRELAPDPDAADHLPIQFIPVLGEVPAGSFQPHEQKRVGRLPVSDPDIPPRAYGLRIKGDSMDLVPGAGDGSTVIIDPDDRTLWPGERYVVRTADGETTFKEYQEGPARLVPCSSNPEHREMMLGQEPIAIEGKVWGYFLRSAPRRSS